MLTRECAARRALQKAQVAKDLAVEGLSLYWLEAPPASPHPPSSPREGVRAASIPAEAEGGGHGEGKAEEEREEAPGVAEPAGAPGRVGPGATGGDLKADQGVSEPGSWQGGPREGDLVLLPLSCLLRLTLEAGALTAPLCAH